MCLSFKQFLINKGYEIDTIEPMLLDDYYMFTSYIEHCLENGLKGDFDEENCFINY